MTFSKPISDKPKRPVLSRIAVACWREALLRADYG
jgi:hypothetical protein